MSPQATYTFKHALIQDAAYQSLLKSRRQQLHRQIAHVLEERFSGTKETQPELLAYHYSTGAMVEQALSYWHRAGQRAAERSAYTEAIHHLTNALELLNTLPETPERAQQELQLQISLGGSLLGAKGWSAPEVERTYTRIQDLCRQLGETPQLFSALYGLRIFYQVRGEYQRACELGHQLVQVAENLQDPVLLVGGHFLLGDPLVWTGEFVSARRHLERAATFYDRRQHQAHIRLFGHDLGVMNAGYHAVNLWYLGYPDQALQVAKKAVTISYELSHAFTLNWSLIELTLISQFRREWQQAQEKAQDILQRCTEYGFLQDAALPTCIRGWALTMQGGIEEGIAEIHKGMADWQHRGAWQGWTWFSSMLADSYREGERPEEGLKVIDEAFDMGRRTGERALEAELYRLKGELSLQLRAKHPAFAAEEEAESCFQQALDIARKQSAKSWELRASTSLARLWKQQRKKKEAHRLLSSIYNWFTEGLETADLREAKALLNELG